MTCRSRRRSTRRTSAASASTSATFTVDAFPGRPFAGEVKTVRKAAQNVQNVVTYIAIISANNDRGELLPGMTANVRITTDSREAVLKVPNSALRFRPPGESADVEVRQLAGQRRWWRQGRRRQGRHRRRCGRDDATARVPSPS